MAAERWQLWMPFHIDRFRGSLHVQAMPAAARAGYIYLLAAAWQSADCTLPGDDFDLQILAGLTQDEWSKFGPLILRRFTKRADGRLENPVLAAEWDEAKRIFERRQEAARRTTATRSPRGQRTVTVQSPDVEREQSEQSPQRFADTGTGTRTGTGTVKQETTSAAASATPAVIGLPLVDKSLHLVTQDDLARLSESYPALDVMQELRKMREWLMASPRNLKTARGVGQFVVNWLNRQQDKGAHGGSTAGVQQRGNAYGRQRVDGTLDAIRRADEIAGYAPGAVA